MVGKVDVQSRQRVQILMYTNLSYDIIIILKKTHIVCSWRNLMIIVDHKISGRYVSRQDDWWGGHKHLSFYSYHCGCTRRNVKIFLSSCCFHDQITNHIIANHVRSPSILCFSKVDLQGLFGLRIAFLCLLRQYFWSIKPSLIHHVLLLRLIQENDPAKPTWKQPLWLA